MNKLPPPNKPPPPPPGHSKATSPPPPPLPPPKNTANYLLNSSSNTLCNGMLANNEDSRSSMNSLNSAGRHGFHGQTITSNGPAIPMTRGGFIRHGDTYNPRSSASSHSSSLHHHHGGPNNNSNNNGHGVSSVVASSAVAASCSEAPIGVCTPHQLNNSIGGPNPHSHCLSDGCNPTQPHSHLNSSSLSDSGGYCMGHQQDNRIAMPIGSGCDGCSCNYSHQCGGLVGPFAHQHHHHHSSHMPMMSSLQPTGGIVSPSDQMMSPGSRMPTVPIPNGHHCGHLHRPPPTCGCHHQPASCCCANHTPAMANMPPPSCGCESHHNSGHQVSTSSHVSQYDCRNGGGSSSGYVSSPANMTHQSGHDLILKTSKDHHINADSYPTMTSTAHTHNLSNSSTTTHSSNVAIGKHHQHPPPLQVHHHSYTNTRQPPVITREDGGNLSLSQQQQQYGFSSAASTSSATASLSNYPLASSNQYNGDQSRNLLSDNKANLQLPPPPPPLSPLPPSSKSRPHSPTSMRSSQMFMSNRMNANNGNYPMSSSQSAHQINQQRPPLPPLPPKPLSPSPVANYPLQHQQQQQQQYLSSSSISSCPTQITTVSRTSPGLQNAQPITRLTSQAGVQNPLPATDVPPPLPPAIMKPQRLMTLTKLHQQQALQDNHQVQSPAPPPPPPAHHVNTNPIPSFINLSLASKRNGMVTSSEAERKTEALAKQVELELEQQRNQINNELSPHGVCAKCFQKVMPSQEACKAMNQIFHAACFVCCECGRTLSDKTFYPVGDKVYCEEDFKYTGHMQSLKNCAACSQPIFDMILPAMGKSYHPKCFRCSICNQCLDGVPFTIDRKNKIYCVKDYHSIYSPKCAACGKSISPIDGTDETVRVVSMDKDYHVDCYCCEDCGLQLTDEEPSRSYPLDNHLLCQRCHINRRSRMQNAISLS